MIGFCTIINPSNPSAATIAIRPNIEGVYGEITSTSRAVVGGVNINTNSPAAGVAGISKGPSAGIYGQSDKGPLPLQAQVSQGRRRPNESESGPQRSVPY